MWSITITQYIGGALGSLTTGRPARSARPLKTMPATSLPKAPWGEDEDESESE